MISADRDALICDFAETYGIYDFRALPLSLVATLAAGLRDDSRIKIRLSGTKASKTEILLAAAVDRLSMLLWAQTEDGRNNVNRPKSILAIITGDENDEKSISSFESAADFEKKWEEITGVKHG